MLVQPRQEPDLGVTEDRPTRPHGGGAELRARTAVDTLLRDTPIPAPHLPKNLPLYLRQETLADVLAADRLYQRILGLPGAVMEFGAFWGRRLALFLTLRELYEPHNTLRRVVGFDTFTGLTGLSDKDGTSPEVRAGAMAVTPGYERHLAAVLDAHESESVNAHVRRYDLCRGDVREALPRYLDEHPETLVSLAYFDLDLYEPTRACMEMIRPRLLRGAVLAFDELAHPTFPGETLAVLESLDLSGVRLHRFGFQPHLCFTVVGED